MHSLLMFLKLIIKESEHTELRNKNIKLGVIKICPLVRLCCVTRIFVHYIYSNIPMFLNYKIPDQELVRSLFIFNGQQ